MLTRQRYVCGDGGSDDDYAAMERTTRRPCGARQDSNRGLGSPVAYGDDSDPDPDSEEGDDNPFALLPAEMAAHIGGYLPPAALAAAGRVARAVAPVASPGLGRERDACGAVAARFPAAWDLLLGTRGGGSFRADPGLLERRCREWHVSCERPCAAVLARMSSTYAVPPPPFSKQPPGAAAAVDVDVDIEEEEEEEEEDVPETDVYGVRWRMLWHDFAELANAYFRYAPGNAPFYARPAPVRALYGVGGALPVFLPGNTVRIDAAAIGAPDDLWGVVGGALRYVRYEHVAGSRLVGRLVFVLRTTPARAMPRVVRFAAQEEPDVEWIELVFAMDAPPATGPRPDDADPLAATVRYAAYVREALRLEAGALVPQLRSVVGLDVATIATGAGLVEGASRYFAASGFPATRILAHTLDPVAP